MRCHPHGRSQTPLHSSFLVPTPLCGRPLPPSLLSPLQYNFSLQDFPRAADQFILESASPRTSCLLPLFSILGSGIRLLKKARWKTRCLEHFCSVPCLQGWPRGVCEWGLPLLLPGACGDVGDRTWAMGLPCCSCSAWNWGPSSFFGGGTSLFLFHSSLRRNTICG